MGQIHVKGRILQYLTVKQPIWDYEIAEKVQQEYGFSGTYWKGTIRALLADLSACGLVESVQEEIDNGQHFGPEKVLFCYCLTDFGTQRMKDTGLL